MRAAILLFALTATLSAAQTARSVERFEVASVKPTANPLGVIRLQQEAGGRFVAMNVSVSGLIGTAYRVRDFQIVGGPSWLSSDRFDIVAKAEGELPPFDPGAPEGPLERMLQALLEDRFTLVLRRETRELPVYHLVLARSDGRPGDNLTRSTVDCAAVFADRARAGQPAAPVGPAGRPTCGMVISPWSIRIGGSPIAQLATVLSQRTNRLVIDRTGLSGPYDVDLQWTPQGVRADAAPDAAAGPPIPAPPLNPGGATLETAIQEQLGLKLEPARAPVPVLVVERAERPTPD